MDGNGWKMVMVELVNELNQTPKGENVVVCL